MKQLRLGFMLCSFGVFILTGCDLNLRKGYGPKASSSIEESKHIGVFLKEYKPIKFQYGNSIKFKITQAYAETIFFRDDTIRKDDASQIIIFMNCDTNYDTPDKMGHFKWWLEDFMLTIPESDYGDTVDVSMRNYKINSPVAPDSLLVYVATSTPLGPNVRNRIDTVGSFYLVAK